MVKLAQNTSYIALKPVEPKLKYAVITGVRDSDQAVEENKMPSFADALQLSLCHPQYHSLDAYPILSNAYAVAAAIHVSPSTAERTFSAPKQVKSRIRSSMVQDRLEGLLLMIFERKICQMLDYDELIDTFAHGSQEMSKALL